VSGLPRRTTITSFEVRESLSRPVRQICESIRQVLEESPPEIAADLCDTGVTIVGGGALLYGITEAIANHLGIPARVADDPLTAVARGTGVFLDKLDVFSRVLSTEDEG
jgi:rod shape-determining protein MreB